MKLYELFISFRYIRANLKQSIIITTAVSIGVAIIIWIPSINLSFIGDLIDKSVSSAPNIIIRNDIDTFKKNLHLYEKNFNGKSLLLVDQVAARLKTIKSYKRVIEKIENIDQITAIAPFASGNAFITRGLDVRGVSLKGIVPSKELNVVDIEDDIIQGQIRNMTINDIVIGSILAEKIKVGLGNRVKVTGHTGQSKNLKVVGIFSTGLRANDEYVAYVNLKSAQQVFDINNDVVGIGIRIKDIYEAEKIARQIEDIVKINVTSWMEDNKQILDQLNRFRLIILFINFLIMFSAASSITSVFVMLIASKSREIGILKSMGAKNTSIMFIFMAQAVILSIIGYLVGIFLAQVMLIWYAGIVQAGEGTIFSSQVPEFRLSIDYAMLAFFYTVFMSVAASIIPSYQAAKLNPVEAINA